jgi:hypothetical protein
MPKYVPRLEGIMHSPSGHAIYLLTLGHISAYNMDNTILLYNYNMIFMGKLDTFSLSSQNDIVHKLTLDTVKYQSV